MNDINLHPEVVVGIFLKNKSGQIALFKSRKWKGIWTNIGGHVEYGEKLLQAVKREAREEAGVELKDIQFICHGELINNPNFFRNTHLIYFHFLGSVDTNELKIDNDEISEYRWFDIDQILKLKNIDKHLMDTIIGKIKKILIDGK